MSVAGWGPTDGLAVRPTRVMVVDDDPDMRSLIRSVLTRFGEYEVAEAVNGREALDSITGHSVPDILVTDLLMPVMTGIELIRSLRNNPIAAGVRILVVSATVDSDEHDEVRVLADAILDKWLIVPNLLNAVRSLSLSVAAPTGPPVQH